MTATVSNFDCGAVTPIAAYLMATLGAALGLRCTTRSLRRPHHRARWLALGSVSFGSGIWAMHGLAMSAVKIDGSLHYNGTAPSTHPPDTLPTTVPSASTARRCRWATVRCR